MRNQALQGMLERYDCRTALDHVHALREIQQEIALLGLWRAKFFEHAAFYGGTALRILYGLDRYSEDLDFSLLRADPGFALEPFAQGACREIESFGFSVTVQGVRTSSAIHSAFLKGETVRHLLVVEAASDVRREIPGGKLLRIKLEVDTDPPGGFISESRYLFQPIPFAVRTYSLPDLFAGKMHALLCRKWKSRVKGRDWYDFAWYAGRHPQLRLGHLEQRMRQSNDWTGQRPLDESALQGLLAQAIHALDIEKAREEVRPFVRDQDSLSVWSREFFLQAASRITVV